MSQFMFSNTPMILFYSCGAQSESLKKFRVVSLFIFLISGLKINLHKSVIFGVGWDQSLVSQIAVDLGCQVGSFPFKYFGLSFGRRFLCCIDWNPVVDAFCLKLSIWKSRRLSIGGCLLWLSLCFIQSRFTLSWSGFLLFELGTYFIALWVDFYEEGQMIKGNFTWWVGIRLPKLWIVVAWSYRSRWDKCSFVG